MAIQVRHQPPPRYPTCHATNRAGERCQAYPVPGARVCKWHGGASPRTLEKARERLLEAADPAAAELVRQVKSNKACNADRCKAAIAILDRAGITPKAAIELNVTQVNFDALPTDILQTLVDALQRGGVLPGGVTVAVDAVTTDASDNSVL